MTDAPFERYIAPFREPRGWWRPVLGMIIILGAWVLSTIIILFGWIGLQWALLGELHLAVEKLNELGMGGGLQPVIVMLLSFTGIWAGVAIVVALLHGRRLGQVFDPESRIRWNDFGLGVLIPIVFSSVTLVLAFMLFGLPERSQAFVPWLVIFLPLVVLIFIQATGEELIFRGYLLQQMAARFRSPIAWAVLPALLFGALHAANAEGTAGIYYMAITAITGVTLAVLVWRTGNLWAATGMHLSNNVISLTGIGVDGVLSGTQLWLYPADTLMPLLQLNVLSSVTLLVLVLSPLGRRLCARPVAI